ncbi:MAG: hypothetical protein HYU64_14290 [Armatimonadetes bacterium]|nr:hypothetical protein [Armatimonadota bacterium]
MATLRFNITLPKDVGARLKSQKNKSALIAEALREYFAQEAKEREIRELRKAYLSSRKEEEKIVREWDATAGDGL